MTKMALYSSVLLMGLLGCSSQKKLAEEAPFQVISPSSQEYTAGREEGGTGFTLKVPLEGISEDIEFLGIYFRGHLLQPDMTEEDGKSVLICNYKRESPNRDDKFVMHADPMEEVGNQPPGTLDKKDHEPFPFDLEADEAVLEYRKAGKKRSRYYKISGITEKNTLIYPSRPKN